MRDLVGIWWGFATTDLRGSSIRLRYLQVALQASPSLAWSCTQYAISDGGGAAAIGCSGGFVAAGGGGIPMRKGGGFGIFFVIL